MSGKYKYHNPDGIYYISLAVVNWVDVFTRDQYCQIIVESLKYCQQKREMELFSWVIMSNHIHLIFRANDNKPSELIRDLKKYTAKALIKAITENPQESRKGWMLWMFKRAGDKTATVSQYQFWQHDSHPIELWSNVVLDQKIFYIHNNPVIAGFVSNPEDWKYSSASRHFIKLDAWF